MGARGPAVPLLLAFALALSVPLLEAAWPGLVLARGSLTALAFAPWFLLALLPRVGSPRERPELPFLLGLALPTLALGLGLDSARGAPPRALALAGASGLLVLTAWAAAAERAGRVPKACAVYGGVWLVLVPGLAGLHFALDFVPRRVAAPVEAGRLFALDPLVLCHRLGRPQGWQEFSSLDAGLAVLGGILVLVLVHALTRGAPEEPA